MTDDGQRTHGPEQLTTYPDLTLDWARDASGLTVFDPRPSRTLGAWITVNSETGRDLERAR